MGGHNPSFMYLRVSDKANKKDIFTPPQKQICPLKKYLKVFVGISDFPWVTFHGMNTLQPFLLERKAEKNVYATSNNPLLCAYFCWPNKQSIHASFHLFFISAFIFFFLQQRQKSKTCSPQL
jgi:hypothetical protein